MGIVVTLAMLVGLLLLLPTRVSVFREPVSEFFKVKSVAGVFLMFAGLWNSLWHGLQHLDRFWGQAALISGAFMITAAVIILMSLRNLAETVQRQSYHWFLIAGLFACFLLYAVTLVQLNLGMETIR